jgi:hypothetical protein
VFSRLCISQQLPIGQWIRVEDANQSRAGIHFLYVMSSVPRHVTSRHYNSGVVSGYVSNNYSVSVKVECVKRCTSHTTILTTFNDAVTRKMSPDETSPSCIEDTLQKMGCEPFKKLPMAVMPFLVGIFLLCWYSWGLILFRLIWIISI